MSSELSETYGIVIRVMNVSDYQNVKKAMGGDMNRDEPLDMYCVGIVKKEQGISLMAIDKKNGGRIVGIVVAAAQAHSDSDRYFKDISAAADYERIDIIKSKVEKVFKHITYVDATIRGKGFHFQWIQWVSKRAFCSILVSTIQN